MKTIHGKRLHVCCQNVYMEPDANDGFVICRFRKRVRILSSFLALGITTTQVSYCP